MKHRSFTRILLAMSVLLSAACSKDTVESETGGGTIGLESSSKDIAWDSTEAVLVKVITEDPEWRLAFVDDADKEWLSAAADRLSSQIRIRPKSENNQREMRTARLEVSTASGLSKAELVVNQLGTGPVLKINGPTELALERMGGEIAFVLTSNVTFDMAKPDWVEATETTPGEELNYRFTIGENTTGRIRSGKIEFTSTGISPELKATLTITQKVNFDLDIPKDISFKPNYVEALNNEFEPGLGIERTIDGDVTTNYHSRFGDKTEFPVRLEYSMPADADRVDYISYLPPAEGYGAFGAIEVWGNTRTAPTLVKLLDFDCKMQRGRHVIKIPNGIECPGKFQIVVNSGGGNYATCAEMGFYKYAEPNTALEEIIAKVFKSQACMELNDEYTQQDVERLPSLLSDIAERLRAGTYPTEFRCSSYAAYTDPTVWGVRIMTKAFSPLDNPMGIEVTAGKPFHVLVGDMHGNSAQILSVTDGAIAGERYQLRTGINEFTPEKSGQLFVQYFVSNPSAATSKPIEIHVVDSENTRVIGYFDIAKHKSVAELERLLKLPDPQTKPGIFTVLGTRVQWNFMKKNLMEVIPDGGGITNTPASVAEGLQLWDNMIRWCWEAAGIDAPQFPNERNNRQLAIALDDGGYMSSNEYFIAIQERSVPMRINPATMFLNHDLMWGPAHEFGHQLDTPITWNGLYESSNNLFSNLVTWHLHHYPTYGPGLKTMREDVFVQRRNFMGLEIEWDEEKNAYKWYETTQQWGFDDPGMFLKPRIFWALYVYYTLSGKDATFIPRMFQYMRKQTKLSDPQQQSMHFYKNLCDFAQLDFTEYFQCYGWFNPIDIVIAQYGVARHCLTPEMVAEAQAYVKSKGYPKAPPIQYIDDRSKTDEFRWKDTHGETGYYELYKNNAKIERSGLSYTMNGETVTVTGGQNAVGYEIRNAADSLLDISGYHTFQAKMLLEEGNRLYAVQADGQRYEIPKE